jgi:hypothetical protein
VRDRVWLFKVGRSYSSHHVLKKESCILTFCGSPQYLRDNSGIVGRSGNGRFFPIPPHHFINHPTIRHYTAWANENIGVIKDATNRATSWHAIPCVQLHLNVSITGTVPGIGVLSMYRDFHSPFCGWPTCLCEHNRLIPDPRFRDCADAMHGVVWMQLRGKCKGIDWVQRDGGSGGHCR